MKKYLLVLVSMISFCGCTSSDDKDTPPPAQQTPSTPEPTVGIITGTVTPANAATGVVLMFGSSTNSVVPDSNGNFQFPNLNPGAYVVYANPTSGYSQSAIVTTSVVAGETKNIGIITMPPETSNDAATMSFTMDGVQYNISSGNISGFYQPAEGGDWSPSNFVVSGSTGPASSSHYVLSISLNNVNGPATYVLNHYPATALRVIEYAPNNTYLYTWSNRYTNDCSVVITSLNLITRRASGTFRILAPSENLLTTTSKTIENGTFTNVYLE